MAFPAKLIGPNGKPLHSEEYTLYESGNVLCVTPPERAHSVWNSEALDTQDELIRLATPEGDGTVEIVDLLISGDEKAGGSVVVRFNDGTNTEIVNIIYVASMAVSVPIHFSGKVEGWKAAYLEAYVAGDSFAASVTVVYVKHKLAGQTYAHWNSVR